MSNTLQPCYQLRKKRNRVNRNPISSGQAVDFTAQISFLTEKTRSITTDEVESGRGETQLLGLDFFGSKYLMDNEYSFRVARTILKGLGCYERAQLYSHLSGNDFI